MELWFILSLVASIFAGLHIFVQKVGSARGYNSSLLNSYSAGLSAIIGFVVAGLYEGYGEFSLVMLGVGLLSGIVYIIGTNLRMDALRQVDATIFLPLHKFVSPLAALIIGIVIFGELMTKSEWWGIILGMVVPLLLISSSEKSRQNHLTKGLMLMVISAIFAAVAAAINKEGANMFTAVLLFAAIANAFSAVVGTIIYRYRKKDPNGTEVEVHYTDPKLLTLSVISGVIQVISFGTFMLAFAFGGALAIVYTIHSLYIVIPIVLSIVFYNEHWNTRKIVAIVLSIGALILMK